MSILSVGYKSGSTIHYGNPGFTTWITSGKLAPSLICTAMNPAKSFRREISYSKVF